MAKVALNFQITHNRIKISAKIYRGKLQKILLHCKNSNTLGMEGIGAEAD